MRRILVVIPIAAAAVILTAMQGPTGVPVVTPTITELGTIRDTTPDGSLLPSAGAFQSPNGRLIAYSSSNEMRVWNSATRSSNIVLNGRVVFMSWSPNSDILAFPRRGEQGSSYVWTLRVDPATGKAVGAPQRVSISPTLGYAPAFSPDGKWIAFARRDGGQKGSLVVVPVNGGPENALTTSHVGLQKIQWSRDGSSIYFTSSVDTTWTKDLMYRVPFRGGAAQVIHEVTPVAMDAGVTSDERFLFAERTTNENKLRRLSDPSGRTLATLTSPTNAWSDDKSNFVRKAVVRDERPRGIRVTELATGATRTIVDTTSEAGPPSWFPDGKRLAMIVRAGGVASLLTMNVDGGNQRKYALSVPPHFTENLVAYNHAELHVSPDGRYAMYLGAWRTSLELVDLTTGTLRTLAGPSDSVSTVTTPVWRPDSKSIRYIRGGAVNNPPATRAIHEVTIEGKDKTVRLLPYADFPVAAVPLINDSTVVAFGPGYPSFKLIPVVGSPRTLVPSASWGVAVSPDGRMVATAKAPSSGTLQGWVPRSFTVVSLTDSSRREIEFSLRALPGAGASFHPDGRRLIIPSRNSPSEPVTFYSVPLDGGAPRAIARVETKEATTLFSLSPDGKYIAYTVGATPRATFLQLDYTAGLARIAAAPGSMRKKQDQ